MHSSPEMRLVKPMSMFTKTLFGYDSVFFPQTEAEVGGWIIPRQSRTPSYVVICGDGSVRWPNDAWAA